MLMLFATVAPPQSVVVSVGIVDGSTLLELRHRRVPAHSPSRADRRSVVTTSYYRGADMVPLLGDWKSCPHLSVCDMDYPYLSVLGASIIITG